jgi:hypothetical protein
MYKILTAALAFVLFSASAEAQTYKGCYADSNTRALPNELMASGATVETCIAAAKAYAFAGVQDGGQCWAGNMPGVTKVPETSCNMPCTANTKEKCGGVWFNSVYAVGGISSVKGAGTLTCATTSDGNAVCTGHDTQALGLCSTAPAVGASCVPGDSCFSDPASPGGSASFFLCGSKSKWWKSGPFTAIPN